MARTWRLGLNLDEFNALFMALNTTKERADFLKGFALGMNLGALANGVSKSHISGYAFGSTMREETDVYRESRRLNGSKGGRPSKKPYALHSETKTEPNPNPSHYPLTSEDQNHTPPTPPEGGDVNGEGINGKVKVNGVSGGKGQKNVKKAPRNPSRSKVLLPLTAEPGTALEAFQAARQTYPVKAVGFNERTRNRETRDVGVGSLARAQRYWADITGAGLATDDELYVCSWVARRHWERTEFLWVPNFDTFYGPEKSLWANFIDEAREAIKERDHAISGV